MSILNYIEKMKEMYEGPRTMAQGPRNMYSQGQLVTPSVDGSRPGYKGKSNLEKIKSGDLDFIGMDPRARRKGMIRVNVPGTSEKSFWEVKDAMKYYKKALEDSPILKEREFFKKNYITGPQLEELLPYPKKTIYGSLTGTTKKDKNLAKVFTKNGIKKVGDVGHTIYYTRPTDDQVDNIWKVAKERIGQGNPPIKMLEPYKKEVLKVFNELKAANEPFSAFDVHIKVKENFLNNERTYIPAHKHAKGEKIPAALIKRIVGEKNADLLIDENILKREKLTKNRLNIFKELFKGPQSAEYLMNKLNLTKNDLYADIDNLYDDIYKYGSARIRKTDYGLKQGYLKDFTKDDFTKVLNNLRKSKDFTKADDRAIRKLIYDAYKDKSKMYDRALKRLNAYNNINHELWEKFGFRYNLEHPLSYGAIKDLKNSTPEQLIRITPVPENINMLKKNFDVQYQNILSDIRKIGPNKELLQQKKMIENLSTGLGLGKFKIDKTGNKILSFGTEPWLKQDIGAKMIENVDLQNKVVDNVKKLDKNKELTNQLIKVFGKNSKVPDSVINLKKTGNINKIIRVLKSLIKRKPNLQAAADNLLNTISEGIIPSVAAAEVEAAEVEAAETAPLKIDTSIPGELIPAEAISAGTLPLMKYGKKIISGLGKGIAGIDLPPIQAAFALMDPTSLAYTLPFSNMAAAHTGMYKAAKTKKGEIARNLLRGMPRKVAQNVLPIVSRASIPFSVAYGVGQVAKASKPDYYIDPETQEPTFYKRDYASNVFPGMIDVYDQAMKISKEKGISYNDALEYVDWQGTADQWLSPSKTIEPFASGGRAGYMGGGIAAIRKPHAIPPERQGLRSIMINGKKS